MSSSAGRKRPLEPEIPPLSSGPKLPPTIPSFQSSSSSLVSSASTIVPSSSSSSLSSSSIPVTSNNHTSTTVLPTLPSTTPIYPSLSSSSILPSSSPPLSNTFPSQANVPIHTVPLNHSNNLPYRPPGTNLPPTATTTLPPSSSSVNILHWNKNVPSRGPIPLPPSSSSSSTLSSSTTSSSTLIPSSNTHPTNNAPLTFHFPTLLSLDGDNTTDSPSTNSIATSSVTVQQPIILDLLRNTVRSHPNGLTLSEITNLSHIPMHGNMDLIMALNMNPKIEVLSNGERYRYKTKYDVRDSMELYNLINIQGTSPLPYETLIELFPTAEKELNEMVRKGSIIRVKSLDNHLKDVFYSRGYLEEVRIPLSGKVNVTNGSSIVRTTVDLTGEIFRNDIVFIGDQFRAFRVSSALEPRGSSSSSATSSTTNSETITNDDDSSTAASGIHSVSIGNFVQSTGGAYSAADIAPHRTRIMRTYAKPFTANSLPLDRPWDGLTMNNLSIYKLGATGDLRILWREIVHHGKMLKEQAKAAADQAMNNAIVSSSSSSTTTGSSSVVSSTKDPSETLLLSLGGPAAFKTMKEFPMSHQELRMEMQKFGLETKMAPGTLDNTLIKDATTAQRQQEQSLKRQSRKVDRRTLQIKTDGHLTRDVRDAVLRSAIMSVAETITTNMENTRRRG